MNTFPPPVTAVSPIVRDAVRLKSEELASAKAALEGRYSEPYPAELAHDTRARLTTLLERVKKLDPYLEEDDDLAILNRYVEQARDDRSMTEEKLLRLEKDLNSKLAKYAARLEVSTLHVKLLEEELNKDKNGVSLANNLENAAIDDDFEMVEGGPEDALEKFEQHAFTKKNVNTKAIEEYLESLFSKNGAKSQLDFLRASLATYGEDVMSGQENVEEELVTWCIADLLSNALLSDATRIQLQDYLENPIALRELTSTLNMKSVRHWNWRCGDKGLPVTARQNAEGKYCIAVDEDILDSLFLHTIAVGWSMKLKTSLRNLMNFKGIWPGNEPLTGVEMERRDYYLNTGPPPPPPPMGSCPGSMPMPPKMFYPSPPTFNMPPVYVPAPRSRRRQETPLPPPPPPVVVSPPPPMNVSRIPPKSKRAPPNPPRQSCPPPPPPPGIMGSLNDERFRLYSQDFCLSRLPKLEGCAPEGVFPETTQAILIKTLATELKVREAFDGSVHALTADFDSFASSLPHETILTVLKFLGMPERWLDFFKRFLAAPLNMGPVVRGTSDQVLTRTCGIPIAHGVEPMLTETLLFFLDVAAHQKTGGYMYRLRDRCYFVGKETQCTTLRNELSTFATTMGLKVHTKDRLDAVPIGFLRFSAPKGGPVSFTLDNPAIDAYARRLKKQLAAAPTVLSWITTWNRTIGTYAEHLFGPLANVFGAAHIDAVIEAHNRIHDILFPGSNLTTHIEKLIKTHLLFPLDKSPSPLEPIIHLPLAYGGLGVKNPYTTLNITRAGNGLLPHPAAELAGYLENEQEYYQVAKQIFEAIKPDARAWKVKYLFRDDAERQAEVLGTDVDTSKFYSFEDFLTNRERSNLPYLCASPPDYIPVPLSTIPNPVHIYSLLLGAAAAPPPHALNSDRISDEVARLAGKLDMPRATRLSPEDRWVLQLYGDECFERFGGLEVWHGESVPREVIRGVRGELGGLAGREDAESWSSVSEV